MKITQMGFEDRIQCRDLSQRAAQDLTTVARNGGIAARAPAGLPCWQSRLPWRMARLSMPAIMRTAIKLSDGCYIVSNRPAGLVASLWLMQPLHVPLELSLRDLDHHGQGVKSEVIVSHISCSPPWYSSHGYEQHQLSVVIIKLPGLS